ncbi:MAG: thiamine/thiamine pyrophosphate ABC transporter permease ThiP [Pseudomonadota bacterium]
MVGGAVEVDRTTGIVGGVTLLAVMLLLIAPVLALWGAVGGQPWLSPGDMAALRFTLWQALVSAFLSVALAVPFARALMRRTFPGRRMMITLLGAPFLLPVIVAILGLLAVWGRSGLASDVSLALGGPRLSIYGWTGVVLAHVFFNMPLVTRLLVQGWQAVPSERFRLAAQLGMSPGAVFRVIEWPMLRAVLPGAFLLVFLLCLTSFAVALTLGGGPRATTLEVAIHSALRFNFDLPHAARLSLIQLALGAAVVIFALVVARPANFGRGLGRLPQRWDAPRNWGWDAGVIAIMVAFLGTPLIFVLGRGLFGMLAASTPGLLGATLTSLVLAMISAGLAGAAAIALTGLIAALPRGRAAFVEGAGLLMMATSPFVIGTGLFILIRPLVDPFAWALGITCVINVAMSLPFALRILVPAMVDVRRDYGRLADSLGMEGWGRFRWMVWPMIRAPLGFAMGLAAALSMGDLGVITLFAPPDVATLPLHMYRLMAAYRMTEAAGVALVLLVLSLLVFWIFSGRVVRGAY